MYGSNQCGSRSPKSSHQPGLPASRARLSRLSRSAVSLTPYRESRSSTSRSLNPTRPCSIRLILEWEPRMASAACSVVISRASRSRRSWAPRTIRWTVGPLARRPKFRTGPSQAAPSDALIATPRSLTQSNAWSSFARDLGIAKSACHILTWLFVTGQLSRWLVEPSVRARHYGWYHALTSIRAHHDRERGFGRG